MKVEALTDVVKCLPQARIIVESIDTNEAVVATGFHVRNDVKGDPIIVIRTGRKLTDKEFKRNEGVFNIQIG